MEMPDRTLNEVLEVILADLRETSVDLSIAAGLAEVTDDSREGDIEAIRAKIREVLVDVQDIRHGD